MSAWRIRVLAVLCFLWQPRGHGQLPPPQNVTLLSKDFDMILTWTPGKGYPPDVSYTVRYESKTRMDKWIKVPHCRNIHSISCNLTCVIPNFFIKFRAQVKAASGRLHSPWVKSQFKEYHLDVELAPPLLNMNVKEDVIHVSATFPMAICVESLSWMYDFNFWEAGSEDKKQYKSIFRKKAVTIDTTALRGNYCLNARSSIQSIDFKHSKFSQPVCMLLNHKGEWKFPFSAMIPVCVLLILLTSASTIWLLKQDAKHKQMPQALDLSNCKIAGPTFCCERKENEFLADCLICTDRPVSQGKKNKTLAQNNKLWMASFLPSSSSEEEEEEEEEEEDSSSFIPYTEMLQFPRRHFICQTSRTADAETILGSTSGGLSLDGGSAFDLSALGFSFFPTRKNEGDTSGSQGNEKASHSHSSSLGRVSLADVRFPAPREHGQHDTDSDDCLEVSILHPLANKSCTRLPADEHCLYRKDHDSTMYYQKSTLDQPVQVSENSLLNEDPTMEKLIYFQTLQVAEDESIASDCDSENCTGGTPPASTVLGFSPASKRTWRKAMCSKKEGETKLFHVREGVSKLTSLQNLKNNIRKRFSQDESWWEGCQPDEPYWWRQHPTPGCPLPRLETFFPLEKDEEHQSTLLPLS
ncbi:interferon lambda receptor 1 isoform X2 [Lagopus leucura]|nr:interferon lambda receptor 1 isoform X2 [Lagopus leucura]